MHDPRLSAIANLAAVLDGRSLDAALADSATRLDESQRAFAAELSYGLCRWHRQLHAIVAARLNKPLRQRDRDIHLLMLLGVWQLMHSRMPAHAAINSCVELTRTLDKTWAGKLVNAVLRQVQRELNDDRSPLRQLLHDDLSIRHAQPKWFVRAISRAWPEHYPAILDALQQRAPMSLRLNLRRQTRAAYLAQLNAAGIAARAPESVPCSIVLQQALPVTRIPGFAQGLVSVQDVGAQLAGLLLDVQAGQRILDACAAPGGKTGHILELADELELCAADIDAVRLARVQQNLDRLNRNAQLLATDAANPPHDWRDRPFDRILLDAPCSATGVMRRHPDIRLLRRSQDIEALATRQAQLLDALWPCLRPGGKLLYATCSLLSEENQQQIDAFLQRQHDAAALPLTEDWGHSCGVGRQTLPGEATMDGFFYALLEKRHG